MDNRGPSLVTSTIRKPTHTGLYTKWNSFVPRRFKINLINCLLDRCYKICSTYEIIFDEFEQIKTMLSRKGYPKYVLDKCIREFFNRKFTTKPLRSNKKDPTQKKILIRLPFLGALSVQNRNEMKSFLHKHTDDKVSVYIVDALSKIGENFRFKYKQPLLIKSGIVYKLTYSCGSTYIGQARRSLLSRIKEHATSEKSEVCKHLLQNPFHWVDFDTPTILGSENDTARLLILQSLLIQEQTPDLNNDSQSSPLMIINT